MSDTPIPSPTTAPPNHHGDHPGFSGPSGFLAAVMFLFGREAAADLAADLARLAPGDRIVDIGCGPGVAVRRAVARGATAIGVDPAPVMLRVARLRWPHVRDAEWRVGRAESLPLADGSADVVWSLSTVHHWADVDAGLAEVRRVLADGGRFVAIERRIRDPHAHGTAGHGWTREQADDLADRCRHHGFETATVATHDSRPRLVSVVATLPARTGEADDAIRDPDRSP